jgi:Putative DNA-binding domain
MDITIEVVKMIGQAEGSMLEYKAVLPPSKNIAQLISSFANADGGYIILGVSNNLEISGLSEDFHANSITHKALDLLSPQPQIYYQYITFNGKKLYAIRVEKSELSVAVDGKIYQRIGDINRLLNPTEIQFKLGGYSRIKIVSQQLEEYKKKATNAKNKLIEHYQSVLKIVDDLGHMLYPVDPILPANSQEGKILTRILFSSFVDNFETYLSDLLYEIFLAKPTTLKSKSTITIQEVLDCSDLQEFIDYLAKQKISKLQKGSVKGFIADNAQIKDLNVIDNIKQDEIEKILQIRHLYSHRNGIVDEKFLKYFTGEIALNMEHQMSVNEICDKLCYLAEIAHQIDLSAIVKYQLAQMNEK